MPLLKGSTPLHQATFRSSPSSKEREMPQEESAPDPVEEARRARFGTLPERVSLADMVEERPATLPDPARDAYNPDEWVVRTCL
jgi:hypothetical protein